MRDRRGRALRMTARGALAGLALALGASAAAAGDYEWPVVEVIDAATLVVDAGADFPPELARLTVRVFGPSGESYRRDGSGLVSELLAGASSVVIRNPRYGDADCECQVVADVVVDGEFLWGPVAWELMKPKLVDEPDRPRPHR